MKSKASYIKDNHLLRKVEKFEQQEKISTPYHRLCLTEYANNCKVVDVPKNKYAIRRNCYNEAFKSVQKMIQTEIIELKQCHLLEYYYRLYKDEVTRMFKEYNDDSTFLGSIHKLPQKINLIFG